MADKEILITKLNESLTEVGQWVEATKDFALEQAPLVVQEILHWGFVVGTACTLIFGAIMILGFYLVWKSLREQGNDWYDRDFMPGILASWVFSLVGVIGFLCNFLRPIKILVAPRLYLLDYFSALLKGN